MVSYCDPLMCVVRRASSTIASKDIFVTTGWILTKHDRNDPYIALFINCSNGSGTLHIYVKQVKSRFSR